MNPLKVKDKQFIEYIGDAETRHNIKQTRKLPNYKQWRKKDERTEKW